VDHQELGLKLSKRPREIFGFSVLADKIKDGEIPFRVAGDAGIIPQLQQANIAVMVLKGFELQLGAVLRLELETLLAGVVFGQMLVKLRLIILVKRRMTKRLFSIRTSFGIHLEQAKIDTQLNFLRTITALKFPDNDLPRLVVPMFEQMRNVEVHGANMAACFRQVNAR
jgi:hypothetical protein